MKRTLLYSLLILVFAACQETLTPEVPRDDALSMLDEKGLVKGEMYVKFESLNEDLKVVATRGGGVETDNRELNEAATGIGAREMQRVFPHAGKYEARTRKAGLHLWYKVKFDERINVGKAMNAFAGIPNVADVAPVGKAECNAVNPPFNPYFPGQWYLHNTGENGMLAGADIGILEAWSLTSGSPNVIVAVIDEIVNFNHPSLSQNMWRNDNEDDKEGDIDQDGNGYVGDVYGLGANENTFQNDTNSGHGTHVAGIIAAGTQTHNWWPADGIAGIAGGGYPGTWDQGVKIMTCDARYGAEAIKYAADMGAVICNNSYHQNAGARKIYQDAVNYFVKYAGCDENGNKREDSPMKGGIVVAAAGNENASPEIWVPASLDNVIAVASINPRFVKSSFSNYAPWVTISAFGGGGEETPKGMDWGIWSTMNDGFASHSGTSQAAPVVSGVAALLVSYFSKDNPNLTAEEIKYRLLQNTLPIDEYNPNYKGMLGAGCVHAYAALQGDMNWPPTVVSAAENPDVKVEQPVFYGEEIKYVFDVTDREGQVTYTVEDPSEAFTHELKDGKLTFSLRNRDCQPGSYTVSFTVTDEGVGDEHKNVQTVTRQFAVRLLPEVRTEVGVENDNKTLTVYASTTFSGVVTVAIYDANGNLVQNQETETSLSAPGVVDISGLSGGTYTVKLTCNNKTITQNIIKL